MKITVKQVSSLEKIRPHGIGDVKTISRKTLMRGERFSYQLALESTEYAELTVQVISPLAGCVKLYAVKNAPTDFPVYKDADEDYLTKEPCLMPDILMPIEPEKSLITLAGDAAAIWIDVKIPKEMAVGEYPITLQLTDGEKNETQQTMVMEVIAAEIPEQQTIFTQWFHTDCIATAHNVPVYSEEHWELIDKYMALASELGINMILTPVITPPLDTEIGTTRPCTQLVKIEKDGERYRFDFTLLKRWIKLCRKNQIQYFEMAHLFSQWGLQYAPNIKVWEKGEESYLFGWHTESSSEEYGNFLKQFLPSLIAFCKEEGIKDRCFFHISDEPHADHLSAYRYACELVKPLLDGCPTMDAISDYAFYETGLIPTPVTATDFLEPFLENKVENQWAYYCCGQYKKVGNRYLAMPSYRNRILGLQLYKYNIKGFLQWGYNFYYSRLSRYEINPYVTTSADKAFPSGDPFSVYPVKNGAVPSLRAVVFRDALSDIEICRKLESFIGREKVVAMIDEAAGMELTFSEYPRNNEFVPNLIEKMEQMIKENI